MGESKIDSGVPISHAMEYKKSTKPIMEKRRRARINASLLELKALLMDVMKQEGVRHQKMEKADILEMAVKHLRCIQKGFSNEKYVLNKYQAGFNECANEVSRYLNNTDNVDLEIRTKVLDHLMNVMQGSDCDDVTQVAAPTTSSSSTTQMNNVVKVDISSPVYAQLSSLQQAVIQQDSQTVIQLVPSSTIMANYPANPVTSIPTIPSVTSHHADAQPHTAGGLQLIPLQLPNGDLAFIIPSATDQPSPASSPDEKESNMLPQKPVMSSNYAVRQTSPQKLLQSEFHTASSQLVKMAQTQCQKLNSCISKEDALRDENNNDNTLHLSYCTPESDNKNSQRPISTQEAKQLYRNSLNRSRTDSLAAFKNDLHSTSEPNHAKLEDLRDRLIHNVEKQRLYTHDHVYRGYSDIRRHMPYSIHRPALEITSLPVWQPWR